MELVKEDTDDPIGDCPRLWSYSYSLIISEKAKNIINNKYGEYVQFLPLIDGENGDTYYFMNVLNVVDCIDYEKSEFRKLMDKYIVEVTKYVFKDCIRDLPIFNIYVDGINFGNIYINDEFKELLENNELEGFKFIEVFDFKM